MQNLGKLDGLQTVADLIKGIQSGNPVDVSAWNSALNPAGGRQDRNQELDEFWRIKQKCLPVIIINNNNTTVNLYGANEECDVMRNLWDFEDKRARSATQRKDKAVTFIYVITNLNGNTSFILDK